MPDEDQKKKEDEEYKILDLQEPGKPPGGRMIAIPLGSFAGMGVSPCTLEMCLDKNFSTVDGIAMFINYMTMKGVGTLMSYFLSLEVSRGTPEIPKNAEHRQELNDRLHEYQYANVEPVINEIGEKYFVGRSRCAAYSIILGLFAKTGMSPVEGEQGAAPHA